ncbi:MAG: hypothetical protein IKH76_07160, partial [Clostridiales bacterium]|nr:hypothetical protein [Clostridiales bacterium]
MIFKQNRQQYILAISVGIAVAAPVLVFPIGVRSGIRPALAVSDAYQVTYGVSEEYSEFLSGDEEVELEDWALGDDEEMIDSTKMEDDGEVEEDPEEPEDTPEEKPGAYSDVPKYTVYQDFDSQSNQPIELLDPQYFAADNTQFYVKKGNVALKIYPDMSKKTLGKLSMGEGVKRIGVGDTWSKIQTADG